MSASKNIHNTNCILRITLIGILTVSCILFNGCSPEAFAAGALVFRYWEVQVQKEREEKIRLARQQESVPVSRQPETVRTFVEQNQKEREEKIRLARQQKSIPVSRQPEIVRTVFLPAEDQRTVEKANQAYRNLEWNESARLLKEAINRGTLSRSDLCEAYILLGAIAYQQGQVNEAESYFKKTSEIDSSMTPSAELYPPPLIKFYKSVAKRK